MPSSRLPGIRNQRRGVDGQSAVADNFQVIITDNVNVTINHGPGTTTLPSILGALIALRRRP
jgi:hypothetical protein